MNIERPNQQGELEFSIEPGQGGVRFLNIPELSKTIPIYNFRILAHHEPAAQAIADGQRMAMYGGVWAGLEAQKRNSPGGEFFWRVKITGAAGEIGRPQEAKPPVMMRPEDAVGRIDWRKHHPKIASLSDFWNFRKLWEEHGAYLHIIAAIRPSFYSFPQRFKTTAREFQARYPQFPAIGADTFAIFWREDPFLRHFATLVARNSHIPMYTAVTTLNPHGEEPPYTFDELLADIRNRRCRIEMINLILTDPLYESCKTFGSHTQAILPFCGEDPTIKIVRIGSLSPEGLEKATGLRCEVLPGAKDVKKNPGENLDDSLREMMETIREEYSRQEKRIRCRFEKD